MMLPLVRQSSWQEAVSSILACRHHYPAARSDAAPDASSNAVEQRGGAHQLAGSDIAWLSSGAMGSME